MGGSERRSTSVLLLAAYASPLIGKLPVATVDTELIVKVLSPVWKTETATRLRGSIELARLAEDRTNAYQLDAVLTG